jgi:hypothetical protein
MKKGIFDKWNVRWAIETKSTTCITCNVPLDCCFDKIERHYKSHHSVSITNDQVLEVSKVYKRQRWYESSEYNFELEKASFNNIKGSIRMEDSFGNNIANLKTKVIPDSDLARFYRIGSLLEREGKAIERSTRIKGTRMVMYGLYENHVIGW